MEFKYDAELYFAAQTELEEAASTLSDNSELTSDCISYIPSGFEYSNSITEICNMVDGVKSDIDSLVKKVNDTGIELANLDEDFALIYSNVKSKKMLSSHADFNDLNLGDKIITMFYGNIYLDTLYKMLKKKDKKSLSSDELLFIESYEARKGMTETDDYEVGIGRSILEFFGIHLEEPEYQSFHSFLLENYDYDRNKFGVDQGSTGDKVGDHSEAKKYLMRRYNLTEKEATIFLRDLNNIGACTYATECNDIFFTYSKNPKQFKEDFGFDMYTTNKYGQKVLNQELLLADLYLNINYNTSEDERTGALDFFNKKKNLEITSDGELNNDTQRYVSDRDGKNDYELNKYLKSKNPKLSIDSRTIDSSEFNDEDSYINSDRYNRLKNKINNGLRNGKTYELGIYATEDDCIDMLDPYNKIKTLESTDTWGEGGGHSIAITKADDEGLYVTSWGEMYYIEYDDLYDDTFEIIEAKIEGVQ